MLDRSKKYKVSVKGKKGFKCAGMPTHDPDTHVAFVEGDYWWVLYDHGKPIKRWWGEEANASGHLYEYTPINEDTTMNPIFGYQASNELNSDSWKQLVEATKDVSDDVLKDTFKQWESEFKEETKQPIPGAWRSAKSVIKNAREQAVPTLTVNELGERVPRGKTAVEKELKASKSLTKPASSVIAPSAFGILPHNEAEAVELLLLKLVELGYNVELSLGTGGSYNNFMVRRANH